MCLQQVHDTYFRNAWMQLFSRLSKWDDEMVVLWTSAKDIKKTENFVTEILSSVKQDSFSNPYQVTGSYYCQTNKTVRNLNNLEM